MARGYPAIFERVGHEIYCGEALYFGGQGWLGTHQRVWRTASIRVQTSAYEFKTSHQQHSFYGLPHAVMAVGFRAELLHFVWATEVLALSTACVGFHHTARTSRQAYIDLRWEQSLARLAQDMVTYNAETGQPSPPPWPTTPESPDPSGAQHPDQRRQPPRDHSRSPRRTARDPTDPPRARDCNRDTTPRDVFSYVAAIR